MRRARPAERWLAPDATARVRRGCAPTAAAIAIQGSSGATGASEPKARRHAGARAVRRAETRAGSPGPECVGHIAVVHRVLRLHARGHAEAGEPRDVVVGQQLGVLDAAPRSRPSRTRRARGGSAWSPIACTAGSMPCVGGEPHRRRPVRRSVQVLHAVSAVGVRVEAERGAGVEGAVGDDLERPDRQQAAGAAGCTSRCAVRAPIARSRCSP